MSLCTLHVGLPKTGSTSIQDALVINRAKLAANGIYVPEAGRATPHLPHHEIAREFLTRTRRQAAPVMLDALKAELEGAGNPRHILMSSEFFQAQLHNPHYLRLLQYEFGAMGYRVQLVAYLRPQVSYIDSFYSQQSKNLLNTLDVDEFVLTAFRTKHYNFRRLLVPVRCSADIDVNFRPFNRDTLQRGVVEDFLAAVGLDQAAIAGLEIPAAKNIRPGAKTVAACVELARRLSANKIVLDFDERSLASRALLAMSDQRGWNRSGFCGITAEQADRIRRRFAVGDDIFSEAMWGRKWVEVFGADCWTPSPLNVFDRARASAAEVGEFDGIVERAWSLLRDGSIEPLAAAAGISARSASPVQRWFRQLRASSAGLRTRWYTGTSAARRD